jgi:DNA-binding response OmpR family regulator
VRILIVEDDKDLNRQLAEALLEQGYVVDRPMMARKAISSAIPSPMTR